MVLIDVSVDTPGYLDDIPGVGDIYSVLHGAAGEVRVGTVSAVVVGGGHVAGGARSMRGHARQECQSCYRKRHGRLSVDWETVAAQMGELPGAAQDTEAELRAAAGEGPGPDDWPALQYAPSDEEGPERLARVRRYAADVTAGRPIRFVDRGRMLTTTRAAMEARCG